jgi:RNA polymerase sigma factor (TIGR02999 family)
MNEISQVLLAVEKGDAASAEKLLPLVYEELRKLAVAQMANEAPGQTLQPTALVHEAFVRLVTHDREQVWDSRGHFFAAAAECMRRILVDRARRKLRPKHAGDRKRVDLEEVCLVDESNSLQLIALSEALDQLEQEDRRKAELVKLRYFVGMSEEEAANALGISRATASRYWTYAKSWLHCALVDAADSKSEHK